jgi:AhpD family alkylhydroperoxidase
VIVRERPSAAPSGGDRWLEETAPEAHRAIAGLEGSIWLDPGLRELVQARTAQLDGCAEELARHAREATALGESPERLAALSTWPESVLFSSAERAALDVADALALFPSGRLLARALGRCAAHFEPEELAQLVLACVAAGARDRLELAAREVERLVGQPG